MQREYPVVTLCGSTRFRKAFYEAEKRLTLQGYIVISVGLFGHSGDGEVWEDMDEGTRTATKEMLDDMHKRKIDMSDGIFVVNSRGYIGESTRSEIAYAAAHGKKIDYLVKNEDRICPCCREFYFTERNAFEICPVCGWEDDRVQRRDPFFRGGANEESLIEARSAFLKRKDDPAPEKAAAPEAPEDTETSEPDMLCTGEDFPETEEES